MKRKSTFAFITLLMLLLLPLDVQAATPRLVDDAGLLSSEEYDDLLNELDDISDYLVFDVVIVTTDSLGGKSATAYADDFYDENGYRKDGILLLVSMEDRDWAISTSGDGIYAFTDRGQEYITDLVVPYLSDGNYAEGFMTFALQCEDFVLEADSGKPYDVGHMPSRPGAVLFRILIALAVGGIVALAVTLMMRGKLKSVHFQASAAEYYQPGSMAIYAQQDRFLYRNVSRTEKESSSDSGGSSTHTSSSGTSHGGSSGKF